MLAKEMAKIAEEEHPTASVEEDDMDATRALDDLRSLKEIKPTQRVLDAAAEREAAEAAEAEREIERQRAAIRAAKEREEMEAEALRRAEEEREAARREEEERRARREAEIERERANAKLKVVVSEEIEELELEETAEEQEMYNLMIEAKTEEEGLAMAIEALKKIHKELGSKNPVAKISSEKLNKKGILTVADKLAGKDLVIEHAAGLTLAVQNELDELMEHDESGMIVVLIDTPEKLEALHATHASLASKFQYIASEDDAVAEVIRIKPELVAVVPETEESVEVEKPQQESEECEEAESEEVKYEEASEDDELEAKRYEEDREEESEAEDYDDIEEMDPDEFAQFACKYAAEIDCSIVDKSLLALYERIEMMEEDGVRLTRKAAVDLIEEAADKAEKQTFGRKLMSFVSPMYDKEGYLILREKDFFD